MSEPHCKTDESTLLREVVVASARPSQDKSRRGVILTGVDGSSVTLVACEQRTAIAWLEAIDLMLALLCNSNIFRILTCLSCHSRSMTSLSVLFPTISIRSKLTLNFKALSKRIKLDVPQTAALLF
jgi:hypothetical protein